MWQAHHSGCGSIRSNGPVLATLRNQTTAIHHRLPKYDGTGARAGIGLHGRAGAPHRAGEAIISTSFGGGVRRTFSKAITAAAILRESRRHLSGKFQRRELLPSALKGLYLSRAAHWRSGLFCAGGLLSADDANDLTCERSPQRAQALSCSLPDPSSLGLRISSHLAVEILLIPAPIPIPVFYTWYLATRSS